MMDRVSRFLLRGAPVRGEIVSLDEAWREVVSRHDLPSAVRDRLGELSAASLLLAATLKFEGALVVQIHGDGPVALFVVECQTDGSYRATVKLREDSSESIAENASLASLVNAGGAGRFVVTLDPHGESPHHKAWQGIVPFDGDSVAEMLEHYMDRSEQLPTKLWLAADERRAVGLLLQRLPDEGGRQDGPQDADRDEDGWNRMQKLAETITSKELLELPPEEVLQRLFWQESLHAFDERGLHFACSCSREKVVGMLRMLGRYEVDSILAERGAVEVRCDFCNELWRLDPVDCAVAFTESPELAPASTTRH
jgi:molecular chaperone Hsp33